MARTDCSATSMPLFIVAVTVAFLIMRFAAGVVAAPHEPAEQASCVSWTNAAQCDYLPLNPDGKLIIYQFYAGWSDPCKQMNSAAFSNRQVVDEINSNFVPVRITDVSRERGKNPQWLSEVEKQYRVFALPTLVVADANGKQVGSLIGNCSSLTTYRFLSRIRNRKV